jgi:UDP:flavonoid glycosyltransferase YjiC (YdhE family)
MSMKSGTIVFGIVGWNIAETTRMIEIAKALPDDMEAEFVSYGGKFESLVSEAGFPLTRLEPREDLAKIDLLWRIDRGETYAHPFSRDELRARVARELELFARLRPLALVMGSVLSFPVSARAAGIPLINVIPFAMSRMYFANGLPAAPGAPKWQNRLFRFAAEKLPLLTRNFSAAATEHGLPRFKNLLSLWEGDINLLTEIPEMFPTVQLPPNWRFTGPIFARLDAPVPAEVESVLSTTGDPVIYFAMGSSANRELLHRVLEYFNGLPVRVIAPVKDHMEGYAGNVPDNVMVTGWLPAHLVNPRCDAAVIHGGQGTVQTACASGTPFLGIGMQPEQSINIQSVVDFGAALRLSRRGISREGFISYLMQLLENQSFRSRAGELRALFEEIDGAGNAARYISEFARDDAIEIPLTPYTKNIGSRRRTKNRQVI